MNILQHESMEPSNGNRYRLEDSSDQNDLWRTLLSPDSADTAALLWHRRAAETNPLGMIVGLAANGLDARRAQLDAPPETYVIRYYVTPEGSPAPEHAVRSLTGQSATLKLRDGGSETVAYIQNPGDLRGLNTRTHAAVVESFDTIESQLPGRFRFERVDDVEKADLTFVSIGNVGNDTSRVGGVTASYNGVIALNREAFQSDDALENRMTALHEILHAVGLRHPQDQEAGKPSNDRVSYRDTVMTYDVNNDNSSNSLRRLTPAGLMPADIGALLVLYPIAADRREGAARVSQIPETHALTEGPRLLSPYVDRTIAVPLGHSAAYTAAADTPSDTYMPAANHVKHKVIQESGGVVIQGENAGEAHIPIHLDTIEMGGEDVVITNGHVTVQAADGSAALQNTVRMEGENNILRLSVEQWQNSSQLNVHLSPESHTRLELTGGASYEGPLDMSRLPSFSTGTLNHAYGMSAQWSRPAPNQFTLTLERDGAALSTLDIHFDELSPMAAAQMQLAFERGQLPVTSMLADLEVPLKRGDFAATAPLEGHGLSSQPQRSRDMGGRAN